MVMDPRNEMGWAIGFVAEFCSVKQPFQIIVEYEVSCKPRNVKEDPVKRAEACAFSVYGVIRKGVDQVVIGLGAIQALFP